MSLLPASQTKERKFKIDLKLTPAQKEIEANSKRFTLVRAGRKTGKTKYSEWKALQWLSLPDAVHWHIAPTYKQAKLISWDAFKRLIPSEALAKKPNDSDLIIHLKNNAQLYLMGSDESDSLRGPAPTSVTLEEAAYHKSVAWHDVIRPNLTVHKAPALFISSPNGFNWFKDLEDEALVDIEANGDKAEWSVFHKTIYDNPYIDRDEIEKIKASCDPRVWSQEYMANYEASVGRVFHEFQDTPRHVQTFTPPSSTDACFRSIDWGLRDDTGALWAMVRGRKLYVYREHAENGLAASVQAQMISNQTPKFERIQRNIIGHDAAKMDAEMKGLTVMWSFMNAGIRPLRKSSRDKSASRDMIQQLLSEDRIIIHPDCRKLRKQLLSYSWKDTAMEKTEDGGDDLIDALHYLAELLQYDLLLSERVEKKKSYEEMAQEAQREVMERQKRKKQFEMEPKAKALMDVSGSPAGYL